MRLVLKLRCERVFHSVPVVIDGAAGAEAAVCEGVSPALVCVCSKMRLSRGPFREFSGWLVQNASEFARYFGNSPKVVRLRRILDHTAPVPPERGGTQMFFGPPLIARCSHHPADSGEFPNRA